ncbi:cobalt-precorrin 5A hydrolase [Calidifontibacillus erzurumensis]|uniref:Cobalamin biosynthesis protein n=1 Tax=Calidifontibacillus erzurumensis TaxID=2741433 RepID=A0A8J8GB68_9BACI|nr:cobalamin biosynthesis protein [Calidifontibacillus erzurumensis]NSL50685.1 cobalamin biosynthesis protein [Calidifontibacillus erzurumensis]
MIKIEEKLAKTYAIVAITKHGVKLARSLHQKFVRADLFYPEKFRQGDEEKIGIHLFSGKVSQILSDLFKTYKGIILFVSLGAVVRMIAPLLKDKKSDPAVVVIDDLGINVISVLSGHLGGANELTMEIASLLNGRPIITTASDVQKTIAVDLFGKQFGWEYETEEKITSVSASVVNQEKVAIIQESGEKNWWNHSSPLPDNIFVYSSIKDALADKSEAALVVTHRMLTQEETAILENGVLYRPKVIVLGIGCNRGTNAFEIEQVIIETLQELKFSIKSVKALCTIDIKKDEQGLIDVVNKYGWEFVTYSQTELNTVEISEPSETVFKYTGAYGVSEPAAKLYSGADELVLTKKKSGNVTISVGIVQHN